MTTNTQRQAAFKERMRAAGYSRIEFWIKPKWREHIEFLVNLLKSQETKP